LPGIFYQELTANYPSIGTLKLQSNGSLYSSTQAVDGWAATFRTARRGLGRLLSPSLLYQMQQPARQRPVHQIHITPYSTIIILAL